ncbi:MAG: aspartate-semialdehyde dehydrogenase, partial [Verrucomicrobia bacterium]|nr:aspartate-semialdehyde dehydrogenase [Verrucomicrobiota bacterium]
MANGLKLAIAGATGAVGAELIKLLEEGDLPVDKLKLLASARSAGKQLKFHGEPLPVEELKHDSFVGVDLAFFSAGAGTSREFAPAALKQGAIVVDNSSAFRMDPQVPLVIPEINPEDAAAHRGTIAVPNCTTIVALMALYPLHKAFHVNRVIAASYQAVSGAGAKAIAELTSQTQAHLAGETIQGNVFPHPIAFNVLPQVDIFLESGYTKEEEKFRNEGRKIMHHPALRASITCVRVPVYRSHSVALNAEFSKTVSVEQARDVLAKAPGVDLIDDPAHLEYPMPITSSGKKTCAVGRLRIDSAFENGLAFWSCGDQLLKGAAWN